MRPRPVAARILLICALAMFTTHSAVEAISTAIPASQSPMDVLPEGGVVIVAPIAEYSWRVWPGGKIEYQFRQQPHMADPEKRRYRRSHRRLRAFRQGLLGGGQGGYDSADHRSR